MTDRDTATPHLGEELHEVRRRLAALEEAAADRGRAEERFAAVFHASPVAICLSTLEDGRFVDVNASFLRLLGRCRQDVIGRTSVEIGLWDDPGRRPQLVETLRQRRSLRNQEATLTGVSGPRRCLYSVELLELEGGPHLLGMFLDLTERNQAEEQLRESEERHRLITELTSDYTYTCRVDADGTIELESVTEGFHRVLGYTLEEVRALGGWAGFLHPDDLPRSAARLPRLLAGERDVDETRVITKAGDVRWVRFSTLPVMDPALGRVVRLVGAVQDVTGRRRAEEAVRESEGRLRAFFDAAFEGIAVHDGGVILDANERLAEMFGYTLREIIGRRVLDLAAPGSRDDIRRHLQAGDEGPYEATGLRKDGSTFPGELRGKAVTFQGRPARVAALRDITKRKRAQEQLRDYARRLLEVQEGERRYLARELHDEVGQTLTGLKLSLERCARLAPAEVRDALAESQALVRDLTSRVRDLSLRLRPTMLDDLGLLPALLWHFERYTAQTGVRVSFEHGPLPERFPAGVETAAYRIVQEALTNVARHAGVPEAVVRLWADPGVLGVQVEDRGRGFALRAVSAASAGLSGMRERARLLGGRLEVVSAPGAGTRVTTELPVHPDGGAEPADAGPFLGS
jgi:PAS domain S-box-containing protein